MDITIHRFLLAISLSGMSIVFSILANSYEKMWQLLDTADAHNSYLASVFALGVSMTASIGVSIWTIASIRDA